VPALRNHRTGRTSAKLAAELRNRLGVLDGDTQGWPNGRRVGDDAIDVAVRSH